MNNEIKIMAALKAVKEVMIIHSTSITKLVKSINLTILRIKNQQKALTTLYDKVEELEYEISKLKGNKKD